jgi:hypothetical protein
VQAKFQNTIGFLVRDNLDITISQWKDVPDSVKTNLWQKLSKKFVLPRGSEELVKGYAMRQLAITFRNWRSELNSKYVKTGLDPTNKYTITEGKWAVFKEQKTNLEFLARSQANSALAKKNKYHRHLGTGGYKRQVPKWREEEVVKKAIELPVLSEQPSERSVNWLHARKPREISESSASFSNPMVEEATKSIYEVAAHVKEVPSHKGSGTSLLLFLVTPSILVVYEASRKG